MCGLDGNFHFENRFSLKFFSASVAIVASLFLLANLFAAAPERSVSVSRQFIVFGTNQPMRGAICDLAESTKDKLLRLLDQRDAWRTPILIGAQFAQANFPEAPSAALTFSQTGAGLKLQLTLTLGADLPTAKIQREILRATILEMSYRNQPNLPAGTVFVSPPDWLLEGVLAQGDEAETAKISRALNASISAGKVPALTQLLQERPALLDAPALQLYRAYSFALVQTIANLPSGRKQLAAFISHLPSVTNDPLADFRKSFPAFADSTGAAEKFWNASVVRFAEERHLRLLGVVETEKELARILGQPQLALENFSPKKSAAKTKLRLQEINRDLLVLAGNANPLYRPLVADYEKIFAQALRGKSGKAAARLAQLQTLRDRILGRMSEIDDYMNWFEATQATRPSGAFDDYLRAADRAAQREAKRRDPISLYLDAMETQLGD